MVDMVVVMVNGKITEAGTYDELITHDGPFAEFLREYFINEPDTELENEHPESKRNQLNLILRLVILCSHGLYLC